MENFAIINFTYEQTIFFQNNYIEIDKFLTNSIKQTSKIYVVNGPGRYNSTRKALTIAQAIKFTMPHIEFFGINLLTDFLKLFGNKCAYIENKLAWYVDKKVKLIKVDELPQIDVANSMVNSDHKVVSCESHNIANYLSQISFSGLEQNFVDKFAL